ASPARAHRCIQSSRIARVEPRRGVIIDRFAVAWIHRTSSGRRRHGPGDLDTTRMARQTALVTGASYGVGAATAVALARAGYDVAITATRAENLRDTLHALANTGARVAPLVLDLRVQQSIAHAFDAASAALGPLDLLVNNAAANLRRLAVDVTPDEWDAVM